MGFGDLMIGLAIGRAKLMNREIAFSFLGWSLENKLISFLRYYTTKTGC